MTAHELQDCRTRLKLTQTALGLRLGVSRNTIARWERGELGIRHPELLRLSLDGIETEHRVAPRGERNAD